MHPLLLLIALASAAPEPATAGPPADPPRPGEGQVQPSPEDPPPEAPTSPEAALEAARLEYFQGEHERARDALLDLRDRLEASDAVGTATWEDTLLTLGEVEFLLGDRASAWRTFEAVLLRRPEATMSTFNHPAEVVHWFELVRQGVSQQVPEPPPPALPPPPPRPPPLWSYAPMGVPQLALGQPRRGIVYGVLQGVLGATSIGAYVHLGRVNRADNPLGLSQDELQRHVAVVRWAVQWPATLSFYGLWAASHLDARRSWRRQQRAELSVQIGDRRLGLAIHGAF